VVAGAGIHGRHLQIGTGLLQPVGGAVHGFIVDEGEALSPFPCLDATAVARIQGGLAPGLRRSPPRSGSCVMSQSHGVRQLPALEAGHLSRLESLAAEPQYAPE
jgi:hypothetical protein